MKYTHFFIKFAVITRNVFQEAMGNMAQIKLTFFLFLIAKYQILFNWHDAFDNSQIISLDNQN